MLKHTTDFETETTFFFVMFMHVIHTIRIIKKILDNKPCVLNGKMFQSAMETEIPSSENTKEHLF